MSVIELKPCPFCGSTRITVEPFTAWDDRTNWHVECIGCGAAMIRPATDDLAEAWNTRAERTCKDDNIGGQFVCSECSACVNLHDIGKSYVDEYGKRWYATSREHGFNYCPNCGAKVVEA